MKIRLRTVAIATSSFACAALLSFSWSPETGVSASVESAQARVGRPGTPMSVAGVARRQNRRAGYGYGGVGYGAGVAAAAVTGAAVATAAGARPWGYGVYGPGGSYAPTAVQPVGPGWGVGAQPYQASVYGQGWNYGADAPGTCYRDCDNYRKALIESGYNPKNYRTAVGTVKQTNY
jgi:hypothetical protein